MPKSFPKRRGWDSNPRALSDKRFSRPPRYDHFDTSPYLFGGLRLSRSETIGSLPLIIPSVNIFFTFFSLFYLFYIFFTFYFPVTVQPSTIPRWIIPGKLRCLLLWLSICLFCLFLSHLLVCRQSLIWWDACAGAIRIFYTKGSHFFPIYLLIRTFYTKKQGIYMKKRFFLMSGYSARFNFAGTI